MNDRDLRGRFDALREADAALAPRFDDVLRRARRAAAAPPAAPRRSVRLWAAVGALAAAVAITAVLIAGRGPSEPDLATAIAQAKEMSSWSAPTDTFLEVSSNSSVSRTAATADRP
jgi:ferric-dicitrate binding protein FerR (iron transport regulator)